MSYENTPVGQLVIEQPARARVFERRAIDYCCQGKTTLAEACARKSIPLEAVIEELESSATMLDASRPALPQAPPELIRHIVEEHHAYLRSELPRLTELAAKVLKAHGDRRPELAEVAATCAKLRGDLEPHLEKEERVLFPWILQLASGPAYLPARASVQAPISVMESEHESVGELLATLRRLTSGYRVPDGGCPTYHAFYEALARLEADTHQHIHAENNLLFPLALGLEAKA